MEHIFINRNMVFSNAKNSHPTAFQTYFDSLEMPFCLFGSEGQSTMTMVHEIGHYYSSLYNSTLVSYDLAEVQSQGNEMLLLNYMKGNVSLSVYKAMKSYQMYSSMSTIVSSVIIDEFERAVYSLDSVEGFGSEEFDAIMSQVCEKFGGEKYVREQVGDVFNYWRQVATNNPVYYISYAVSATAAINICAELDVDTDSGREMYRAVVEDVSEEDTFLTALAKAGIASPFTDASTEKILATMLGN